MHKMFRQNFVRSSLDKIIHRVSPGPVSIDQDQKFPPLPLTAHSPPAIKAACRQSAVSPLLSTPPLGSFPANAGVRARGAN